MRREQTVAGLGGKETRLTTKGTGGGSREKMVSLASSLREDSLKGVPPAY